MAIWLVDLPLPAKEGFSISYQAAGSAGGRAVWQPRRFGWSIACLGPLIILCKNREAKNNSQKLRCSVNVRQIRLKPIVGFNGQEYEILYYI